MVSIKHIIKLFLIYMFSSVINTHASIEELISIARDASRPINSEQYIKFTTEVERLSIEELSTLQKTLVLTEHELRDPEASFDPAYRHDFRRTNLIRIVQCYIILNIVKEFAKELTTVNDRTKNELIISFSICSILSNIIFFLNRTIISKVLLKSLYRSAFEQLIRIITRSSLVISTRILERWLLFILWDEAAVHILIHELGPLMRAIHPNTIKAISELLAQFITNPVQTREFLFKARLPKVSSLSTAKESLDIAKEISQELLEILETEIGEQLLNVILRLKDNLMTQAMIDITLSAQSHEELTLEEQTATTICYSLLFSNFTQIQAEIIEINEALAALEEDEATSADEPTPKRLRTKEAH